MRCTTCHDPHEVTSNDWTSQYTVPNLKKNCQDCHTTAAYFFSQGGTHSRLPYAEDGFLRKLRRDPAS